MSKRNGACLRCHKFNSYNSIETGYFCSVKCQIEYADLGPILISEEEKDIIYKESQEEMFKKFRNKVKKRNKMPLQLGMEKKPINVTQETTLILLFGGYML